MKKHYVVTFEDRGQDVTRVLVSFDNDFVLGQVIDSGYKSHPYNWQYVLNGKPQTGAYLVLSKSPKSSTWASLDITKVEEVNHKIMALSGCENTK